jgi:hypothetical protein
MSVRGWDCCGAHPVWAVTGDPVTDDPVAVEAVMPLNEGVADEACCW